MWYKYIIIPIILLQIATRLRQELAASNLQLIREFTFNTEQNVTQAVESLRVSIKVMVITINCFICLHWTEFSSSNCFLKHVWNTCKRNFVRGNDLQYRVI